MVSVRACGISIVLIAVVAVVAVLHTNGAVSGQRVVELEARVKELEQERDKLAVELGAAHGTMEEQARVVTLLRKTWMECTEQQKSLQQKERSLLEGQTNLMQLEDKRIAALNKEHLDLLAKLKEQTTIREELQRSHAARKSAEDQNADAAKELNDMHAKIQLLLEEEKATQSYIQSLEGEKKALLAKTLNLDKEVAAEHAEHIAENHHHHNAVDSPSPHPHELPAHQTVDLHSSSGSVEESTSGVGVTPPSVHITDAHPDVASSHDDDEHAAAAHDHPVGSNSNEGQQQQQQQQHKKGTRPVRTGSGVKSIDLSQLQSFGGGGSGGVHKKQPADEESHQGSTTTTSASSGEEHASSLSSTTEHHSDEESAAEQQPHQHQQQHGSSTAGSSESDHHAAEPQPHHHAKKKNKASKHEHDEDDLHEHHDEEEEDTLHPSDEDEHHLDDEHHDEEHEDEHDEHHHDVEEDVDVN